MVFAAYLHGVNVLLSIALITLQKRTITLSAAEYERNTFPSFIVDKQHSRCIRRSDRSLRHSRIIQVAQLGITFTLRVTDILTQNHVFQQNWWNALENFHLNLARISLNTSLLSSQTATNRDVNSNKRAQIQ